MEHPRGSEGGSVSPISSWVLLFSSHIHLEFVGTVLILSVDSYCAQTSFLFPLVGSSWPEPYLEG